jgi:hypothetical protein
MKEKDKLNSKAAIQPPTINPLTKDCVINTIAALITKENKPIVRQVIGNAKNCNTGFTKVFNKVNTNATFTATIGAVTIG